MSLPDNKVQQAINFVEPIVTAAQGFLSNSDDKEDKDKAIELISSWRLIVNQCEIASDARTMIAYLENIQKNDATL